MRTCSEYISEKKIPFNQAVDWCKRYPEVREVFSYAGNIQELDAIKANFLDDKDNLEKYPEDAIAFFYDERKKSLRYGADINKSDDLYDPDNIDMKARFIDDVYSKYAFPENRPNM